MYFKFSSTSRQYLKMEQVQRNLLLSLCLLSLICFLPTGECKNERRLVVKGGPKKLGPTVPCRAHTASIKDFGAVGDGKTCNTAAFKKAMAAMAKHEKKGGGMLVIPPGKWLTGPFNLTSRFTLFLEKNAVILASTNISDYPPIAPLKSYGRGRDLPGPRHSNFIAGSNLTDVVITGNNGTIDGQGQIWWDKYHANELNYTRGYLFELMYSTNILVSNVTFVNSSSWQVHPVYCKNVIFSAVTVLAPVHSPNTDGIDPDSCSEVRIEDCYIVSGDDCIAIKSGWDEYGIAVGIPSENISVRRLTCISPTSAVIALGSEMSGGIRNVRIEDITVIDSESGVRIKSGVGRGGFVKDIYLKGMNLYTIKWLFWMTSNYGQHPDDKFDPKALPEVSGINYNNVYAENATMVAKLEGLPNDHFKGICISNVTAQVIESKDNPIWNCTDVEGVATGVTPEPCPLIKNQGPSGKPCAFPKDTLAIDKVVINQCPFKGCK